MRNRTTRVTGKHRKPPSWLCRWARNKLIPAAFLAGALLIIAYALNGSIARADVGTSYGQRNAHIICTALDQHPTVAGVDDTLRKVMRATGFNQHLAGEAVGIAVLQTCRYHQPLLQRFVLANSGTGRRA